MRAQQRRLYDRDKGQSYASVNFSKSLSLDLDSRSSGEPRADGVTSTQPGPETWTQQDSREFHASGENGAGRGCGESCTHWFHNKCLDCCSSRATMCICACGAPCGKDLWRKWVTARESRPAVQWAAACWLAVCSLGLLLVGNGLAIIRIPIPLLPSDLDSNVRSWIAALAVVPAGAGVVVTATGVLLGVTLLEYRRYWLFFLLGCARLVWVGHVGVGFLVVTLAAVQGGQTPTLLDRCRRTPSLCDRWTLVELQEHVTPAVLASLALSGVSFCVMVSYRFLHCFWPRLMHTWPTSSAATRVAIARCCCSQAHALRSGRPSGRQTQRGETLQWNGRGWLWQVGTVGSCWQTKS